MGIKKEPYGEYNGKKVYEYILDNENGLVAHIINYGGIITKLIYNGVDVVLGRDSLEEYLDNRGSYGATIGRCANCIENAEIFPDGKSLRVYANYYGKHSIHGGKEGFSKKVWESKAIDDTEPSLELSLISPDGDEGFPGELNIKVTYTLTKDNALRIHYEGETDKDTVINMTNHSYFNLNGHDSGTVYGHTLWLASSFYTPYNDGGFPSGEILSVKNTLLDFTQTKKLEEYFNFSTNGLDYNLSIDGFGYRLFGELIGDKTGIKMKMYTDCNGVQLFSPNSAQADRVCKNGVCYDKHGAICFETQAFPGFAKFSHFPGGYIKRNEKYDYVTVYKFSQ